jgi:hypothetical protein
MEESRVVLELSDFGCGIAKSPRGIESNFEEIEVDEITWIGDDCDIKTVVTITGYLNDRIEMVVKWNEEESEKYKENQTVLDLIEEGKELILEDLKNMAIFDEMNMEDDKDNIDDKENEAGYSRFELNSLDRKGNEISISVKGVDDQELAPFGGLDLHIKAVRTLIANTNGTDFAKDNGDFAIEGKVFALYLNEIGELIRNLSLDKSMLKNVSNMDLVKHFMDNWHKDQELVELIEKDNEDIRKETEALRKEEDEIWNNIMREVNKKLN